MPPGNRADRGCNMTLSERVQTSLWCGCSRTDSQPALGSDADMSAWSQGHCWCYCHHRILISGAGSVPVTSR
jgi:hypothetical protein